MSKLVAAWRKDVFGGDTSVAKPESNSPQGKTKKGDKQARKELKDDRPNFPSATSNSHGRRSRRGTVSDTAASSGSSGAPNCSYFVNWKNSEDLITGTRRSPSRDLRSHDRVNLSRSRCRFHHRSRFRREQAGRQDRDRLEPARFIRIKIRSASGRRIANETVREWKLGTIKLEPGRGLLKLKALDVPGTRSWTF